MAPMLVLSLRLPSSKPVALVLLAFTAFAKAQIVGSPSALIAVRYKLRESTKSSTFAIAYSPKAFVGRETARIVKVSESTKIHVVA